MAESLEEKVSFPFDFYGDIYKVVLASDRKLYVPLKDMCATLGIDTRSQARRIRGRSTLARGLNTVKMATDYQESVRIREVLCLDIELVPEWIGGMDEARISPEALPAVMRLKTEFSLVVRAYFRGALLPEDVRAELDSAMPPAMQKVFALAESLARSVNELKDDLHLQTTRLDQVEKRMIGLEGKAEEQTAINDYQAAKVKDMIAALGYLLEKRGLPSYANVHATLKKRFHYTKYTLITRKMYPRVVDYLQQWYRQVAGPEVRLPEAFTRPDQPDLL